MSSWHSQEARARICKIIFLSTRARQERSKTPKTPDRWRLSQNGLSLVVFRRIVSGVLVFMSNNALLLGTASKQVFPLLQKKPPKHEVIACGQWQVPLLWFAIFRFEDMQTWKWPGKDGPPFELRAPVVARQKVAARLKEAVPLLEAAAPKVKTWKEHMLLLGKAIDSLPSHLKFVTCEWEEIIALHPPGFITGAKWLLAFFGGEKVRQPLKQLETISGTKLGKAIRDPAKSMEGEFKKQDWKTLAALLGVEWEKELPWTPRSETTAKAIYLSDLIHQGNVRAVKAALLNKVPVGPSDVARAARKDPRILKLLLESGVDPNGTCPFYSCALLAAFHSKDRVSSKVRMLLDAGADVNHSGFNDNKGPTVLYCCYFHGMEFAKEVLASSKIKYLKQFLAKIRSGSFAKEIEEKQITWTEEFTMLAQKELDKRRGKKGRKGKN